MSYNLKNNNIVIIAVAIAAIMTISPAAYAQTADNQINTEAPAPQVQENDDLFGLDEPNDNTQAETNSEAAPSTAVDETGKAETEAAAAAPALDENSPKQTEPAPQNLSDDATAETQPTEESDKAAQQNNVDLNSIPDTSTAEGKKALDTATSDNDEEIAIEAPKSPFENFGNAILSKVDNSLFNQMSNIEKQTTILNLVGDDKVKYSESVDENGKKSISVSSDGENFESDAVGDANLVSKDGRVYLEIDDLNYSIDITDDLADGKEEVKVKDADNKEHTVKITGNTESYTIEYD